MEGEFKDEPRIGGHNFVFVDELSPGQTCSICLLAMRSPVQTAVCGHRFCESCLLKAFRESEVPVCPQDRSRILDNGGFFRDVAWEREILSLRVKCKKNERGCDWTGMLRHYEEHFVICQYEDVTCYDCKGEMQRRLLHEHTTSQCPNRIVQCEYCEKQFAFWLTKFHEDHECARFPLECPQECGLQIPREEVASHLRDDCMMTMVVCPYQQAGCTFHDTRSNLQDHLEIACEEHLSKTWSELLMTKDRFNELKTENKSMKELLDKKSGEMSELQRQLQEIQFKTSNDEVQIGKLKHLIFTMQFKWEGMEEKLLDTTSKSKGIMGRLTNRKAKSSRQGQTGQKGNSALRERSGSSIWN